MTIAGSETEELKLESIKVRPLTFKKPTFGKPNVELPALWTPQGVNDNECHLFQQINYQ